MYRQGNDRRDETKQALKDIQDKIDKALFFGFGDALTEKAVNFSIQKSTAVVPVTTRAVGFYTQCMYKTIYELYGRRPDCIPECSPYAFYRVSLAQFEYRLLCGKSTQVNTLGINAGAFYRPRLTIEERDIVKSMAITFSPLANMLAGVGSFDYKNEAYCVKCPSDEVLGILYSNLRDIVERMANPATPHTERLAFYEQNPLPFASWNQPQRADVHRRIDQHVVDVSHPVLLNPADFMPAGYDVEDFEHDVHRVKNFISFVARKEVKMKGAVVDYKSPGHQRILVSNDAAGLRNPDRHFGNQWADEDLPQGDLHSFWTPVTIPSQDFFMGIMNLVGERRAGVGDAFAFRSPLIARGRALASSWRTIGGLRSLAT